MARSLLGKETARSISGNYIHSLNVRFIVTITKIYIPVMLIQHDLIFTINANFNLSCIMCRALNEGISCIFKLAGRSGQGGRSAKCMCMFMSVQALVQRGMCVFCYGMCQMLDCLLCVVVVCSIRCGYTVPRLFRMCPWLCLDSLEMSRVGVIVTEVWMRK